jgi:hypothetical protein
MREGQASGRSLSAGGDNINRDSRYQILSTHRADSIGLAPETWPEEK